MEAALIPYWRCRIFVRGAPGAYFQIRSKYARSHKTALRLILLYSLRNRLAIEATKLRAA
jgi:hypothetical protein